MADDQDQRSDDGQDDVEQDQQDESGAQDDAPEDDAAADQTVSRTEYEKLLLRMKNADKRATAAENKIRERDQQDMSELDRAKAQVEQEKQRADAAEERVKAMVIENAFHRENKYSWHDVGDAIAALDLSGVEVTEDGQVTGMADAIKAVVKKKPHYVKSKQEGDDGTDLPAANGASNGRRKGEKADGVDRKALVSRFPALGK